jgi:5'-3' exoribonuclease 1
MGIPRFAKTLMIRYPLIIRNIRNQSDIPIIHNLYLDLNSTIHDLSHSSQDNLLALLKDKSYEQIYQETCEFINQMIQMIKPKSLLMIALDGVSPIAKISDQLKSRYSKSFNIYNPKINDFFNQLNLVEENTFDKNEISPCTEFMINLETYLDNYI